MKHNPNLLGALIQGSTGRTILRTEDSSVDVIITLEHPSDTPLYQVKEKSDALIDEIIRRWNLVENLNTGEETGEPLLLVEKDLDLWKLRCAVLKREKTILQQALEGLREYINGISLTNLK